MAVVDDAAYKSSQISKVQQDWDDREFVQIVQLNIQKLASFLQAFESTVRNKLGDLNSKLNKLERSVDYCEAAIHTSLHKYETYEDDDEKV